MSIIDMESEVNKYKRYADILGNMAIAAEYEAVSPDALYGIFDIMRDNAEMIKKMFDKLCEQEREKGGAK